MCKCDPNVTPPCEKEDGCVMDTDTRYAYRYLAKFGVKFVKLDDVMMARALVSYRAIYPYGKSKTNIHTWWVKFFYDIYAC